MTARHRPDPHGGRSISSLQGELAILMRVASIAAFLITVGLVLPEAIMHTSGAAVLAVLVLLPASVLLMAVSWLFRA